MANEPRTIDRVFAETARTRAGATAIISGERSLTYRELDHRATQLARRLRSLGIERDVPVALMFERSIEHVVAVLAVLKAGGAYVALDPSYPAERLAFMLEDSAAPVVITERRFRDRLPARRTRAVVCLDAALDRDLDPASARPLAATTEPGDLAALIYTSGSTGRPKAVELTHRGIVGLLNGADYLALDHTDVVAFAANISFDASFVEMFGALLNGGSLVVVDADILISPEHFARLLVERGITTLFLTTGLLNQFGRMIPGAFAGLKTLHFGGDVADVKSVRAILEQSRPKYLLNAYGPTECTACALVHAVADVPAGATSIPIGRPVAGAEVLLIDGEICLGGPRIARGYYRRPELTRERFVPHPDPDPARAGERIYKTGDLGRILPNGEIEFLGRADQQVKIRGFRVELGEVEAVLGGHPALGEAVVVAHRDSTGEKYLVGYVAAAADTDAPGEKELKEFLAEKLPGHMVPRAIVVLDRLPLTPNGKVDRAALRPPTQIKEAPVLPRTETERGLAELYAEVLDRSPIGVRDNFFELGGHSLSAMQLLARMRTIFARELPARALFEHPTIETLAPIVDDAPPLPEAIKPKIERDAGSPPELTYSQGRVWFIESLEPGNIAYNSGAILRLRGALDVSALEKSISEIVRRHESLRTTIESGPEGPVARLHPPFEVQLDALDRANVSDRVEEARNIARADAQRPFDPRKLPLIRWTLIRFAEDDHALAQIEHHLVHDGWSFNVFLRELCALYRAFVAGERSPLPEPAIQLSDFARWHRRFTEGEPGKLQIEYWKSRLAGAPVLELPTSRPRPPQQTFVGRAPRIVLEAELVQKISELARSQGATVFISMLAAFEILLARWSGQDEIVLGTGIANRRERESEQLIGMLINNVVLRTALDAELDVKEAIRRVRETVLEAFERQDVPFERVVEAVRPVRDPSRNPLIQVMFSFHDAPMPRVEVPGLEVEIEVAIENGTSKLDLNVIGVPDSAASSSRGGMTLIFEHNSDLFDAEAIEQLIAGYRRILEQLPVGLERRISELDLLTEVDKERQLVEWNHTRVEYPRDATIPELFDLQVAKRPDQAALISADGRELTYRDLQERADHFAAALNVEPGARVGLIAARTPDLVIAMLGILKAGAAYVPLDPAYPEERLRLMLSTASPSVLCGERALLEKFSAFEVRKIAFEEIPNEALRTPPKISAEDSAYFMFTSGSTGEPRAVDVPHRAIIRLVIGADYARLDENETFLHLSPISFDASTFEIWAPLLNGGRCVLFPEHTPSPKLLGEIIEKRGITTLWLTSTLFNAVIDDAPQSLSKLRQLLAGGEALSVPHVQRALELLPNTQLINGYGPTESTTFACCYRIPKDLTAKEISNIPIGRPIANTTAYIFDERKNLLPTGVLGELYLGGDGLARGYFGRPDLTAEKFIDGLYRTGDRVRRRFDGNLEFIGRNDHQIKIRGFRVELGEIEAALALYPGIKTSAAIVQRDQRGDKKIAAFAVPEPGVMLAEPALRTHLRHRLPEHMVPASIAVIDALPLTPVGKVDRAALEKRAPSSENAGKAPYTRPVDPSERIMAEIWERLLGVSPVGRHDNFFALGGHSLLAARLVDEMERALGVRLPLTAVFSEATIAVMARKLREKAKDAPLLAPIQTRGSRPPLFFMHGDFNGGGFYTTRLAQKLGAEQPFYIVHPFGVHGGGIPRTVEAMAEQYCAELRSARAHGPYRLGGYCTGGLIAFEVARRLEQLGEIVDRLILLDSVPRNVELSPLFSAIGEVSERAAQTLEQRLKKPLLARAWLTMRLRESEGRPLRERLALLKNSRPKNKLLEPAVPAPEAEGRAFELLGIYRRIMAGYVPRKYSGRLTILWPRDDANAPARRDPSGGWSKLAKDVDVRTIPGTHASCLTTHWEELAAEMHAALEAP